MERSSLPCVLTLWAWYQKKVVERRAVSEVRRLQKLQGYRNNRSYSVVGILMLKKLRHLTWQFRDRYFTIVIRELGLSESIRLHQNSILSSGRISWLYWNIHLSPGDEREKCRPVDRMRQTPFIHLAQFIISTNFYIYVTVSQLFPPFGTLKCVLIRCRGDNCACAFVETLK